MSDDSYSCPNRFLTRDVNGFRACGRQGYIGRSCLSTFYNYPSGFPYSKVCGRIRGYQLGRTEGFSERAHIAAAYVDGVSLTHGYGEDRHTYGLLQLVFLRLIVVIQMMTLCTVLAWYQGLPSHLLS